MKSHSLNEMTKARHFTVCSDIDGGLVGFVAEKLVNNTSQPVLTFALRICDDSACTMEL